MDLAVQAVRQACIRQGPFCITILMRRKLTVALAALLAAGSASAAEAAKATDYVDPFIGTTNFGTTNPGAVCPNGMMSVSPFNVMGSELNVYDKDSRWWSTPYCFENSFFTGMTIDWMSHLTF